MAEHAPSYYAATASRFSRLPSLQGDELADVVVVGAGFTGLSAALSAAEAGYSVTVLEANRVGWGASGRNGGQMIPGLRWYVSELVDRFGKEEALRLIEVAGAARASVLWRIARHDIDCDLREGHFLAAAKPSHFSAMQREMACIGQIADYPSIALVPAAEVRGIVASDVYHGGLFDAAGGHIHPLNYALGLADAALAAGVRIHEQSAVTRIGGDGDSDGRVAAHTAEGRVKARFGVLACDAFMHSVDPALARRTMPVANYNIATVPLGDAREAALIPSNAAVADSRFVLNYFRLSADGRLIFGGGEKYSPTPPRDIAAFVRPYLEAVFPQLSGIGIDYAWGGLVGVTMNRLPDFGRRGNWFHAHGYSGQGVLLSTLAGELIVEAMQGTAERFDVFAQLPVRQFPGGRLLRHPLHVAGMLWYALRDRL